MVAMDRSREAQTAMIVLDGVLSADVLRAMADATQADPRLGIVVLGPLESQLDVHVAFASGASVYLPSTSSPSAVADAVVTLTDGAAVLPRTVSFPLLHQLRAGGRADGRRPDLTSREWEVLVLLRQGRSTAEIARRLLVSEATVRSHAAALERKLGAANRRELARPHRADDD
jgi:DNA-binding NarL/FixJ family response regulator